jgi:hypothetical protein
LSEHHLLLVLVLRLSEHHLLLVLVLLLSLHCDGEALETTADIGLLLPLVLGVACEPHVLVESSFFPSSRPCAGAMVDAVSEDRKADRPVLSVEALGVRADSVPKE